MYTHIYKVYFNTSNNTYRRHRRIGKRRNEDMYTHICTYYMYISLSLYIYIYTFVYLHTLYVYKCIYIYIHRDIIYIYIYIHTHTCRVLFQEPLCPEWRGAFEGARRAYKMGRSDSLPCATNILILILQLLLLIIITITKMITHLLINTYIVRAAVYYIINHVINKPTIYIYIYIYKPTIYITNYINAQVNYVYVCMCIYIYIHRHSTINHNYIYTPYNVRVVHREPM